MKSLVVFVLYFIPLACFGQTKLIAHRSHSGNNANFRTSVEQNLFNIERSNFGLFVRDILTIDTVILKNNKIIVLGSKQRFINNQEQKKTFINDTYHKSNFPSFFKLKNRDSLKTQILKIYKGSKINNTRFIGFDK